VRASASPALLAEIEIPALLDLLPSGVLVVDSHGRPVQMNQTAQRLVGHLMNPREPVIEAALRVGLRAADSDKPVARDATPLTRAVRGERVPEADYVIYPPQGPLWLRVSAFPVREAPGSPTGAVYVFTDVTPVYRAQEELARLQEAQRELTRLRQAHEEMARLQEAEHHLRLALEASRMGTWSYEIGRDWVEVTPRVSTAVGRPLELVGGPLHVMLERIHPEDRERLQAALRAAVEHGSDLELEARVLRTEGPPGWLLIKGRVFRDPGGQARRVVGVAMDISERKEAEAARHMLAHAERLRALGQMASGIAHDLNQSLALISGYGEMARQELQLAMPDLGRIREMVEITAHAAIEGGQALKRLLSFARTQELIGETEIVDLQEVVREAAGLTAPRWRDAAQAEGRPINLEVHTERGCIIEGSASGLREALINLIFNAVDALPRGGTIRVGCRRSGDRVEVEVADTGTGIPPEVRPRIFDPFFTTKGERGTGLGLAQVLTIVQRYRGSIALDSEPGGGTSFRLTFPSSTGQPAARPDTPERVAARASRSITILVIDDEPQLARMAALALTQRGHQVLVARSGEEAVAQLQQRQVDLVISDLGLGAGMNGWDLAEVVRRRWPGARFVLVTGWGAAITPDEARDRGVDHVMAKPYRIAELRQIADSVAGDPETR
jgi:PAS domain S-box-containing protein